MMHRAPSAACRRSSTSVLRLGAACALLALAASSCTDAVAPYEGATLQKVAGDQQAASPGTAVAVAPAVRLVDVDGNALPGMLVRFTPTRGAGSVIGGEVVTDGDGRAAVGGWTLGGTEGENELEAVTEGAAPVTFAAIAGARSPGLSVSIVAPTAGGLAGDSLPVTASVTGLYSITSVRARVGTAEADLVFVPGGTHTSAGWHGMVPLDAVPRDTQEVIVTARDANGGVTTAARRFVHDRRPRIVVASPGAAAVARPSVDYAATCTDDDPAGCRSFALSIDGGPELARGTAQLSGTASLAAYEGQAVVLRFAATDSRDQTTVVLDTVLVESSAALHEIVSGDGRALDLYGDRLLFRNADGTLALRRAGAAAAEQIPGPATRDGTRYFAFATPAGAIFAVPTSSTTTELFEWRNGTLLQLGATSGTELYANGSYAIYSIGTILTRRELIGGTNATVTNAGYAGPGGVAPNGDVVFSSTSHVIHRYRDGASMPLPDQSDGLSNNYPITDGINVVYMRATPCCSSQTYQLVLNDGTSATALGGPRPDFPSPLRAYAVNGGWTAFTAADAGGVYQLWTRSPTGQLRQVSIFGVPSRDPVLAPDGTVVFTSGNRRYVAAPAGAPRDVMSALGTVLWRDGRFVALVGRSAFALTP